VLNSLHIENIAVIETADIGFFPGLNVLTGETGAGKSIVIDAIGAVMGERTSRDIIRTGAGSALVRAVFSGLPALDWFEKNGVFPDKEGRVTVERRLAADGKNQCRVNSTALPLASLRELGETLLSIHGQRDSLQLMDEDYHLRLLDDFSGNELLREAFLTQFRQLLELDGRIRALTMDEAEKNRRAEMLKFQIDELESAHLEPGEDLRLRERQSVLRNFGKVMDAISAASFALSGGDDSAGAVSAVYEAAGEISSVSAVNAEYEAFSRRLNDLSVQLEDVARDISCARDALEFSPQEQDEVESRLDQLHRLGKKYGHDVEDMLTYLENSKRELSQIEHSDEEIARLTAEREKVRGLAEEAARVLSEDRKKNALVLSERILEELQALDMGKIRFEAEITPRELDERGADSVRFLMSANVGEALKPINRIASGGELSRIMLAMKNVFAAMDPDQSLVFDEIDTGVSGRAAQRVGEKLAQLSTHRQVLCVTHLPQIAAMADAHFDIRKSERDGRTYTEITLLDREGRIRELARLHGGDNITEHTRASAGEQLDAAAAYKRAARKEEEKP